MPSSHKTHPLITGTILLTAAGLLSRVLGFFYRIFLSRTIGAEGLGIYQMIFPIYGIFFSLCAGSIQTAISRFTAADPDHAKRTLLSGFSLSFAMSLAAAFVIRHFSVPLAEHVLMEPRCAPLLDLSGNLFSPMSALLALAAPLMANRLILNLLQSAETIMIPERLTVYGLTRSQAVSTYGTLTGMAMPFVLFPSALVNSLAVVLLPVTARHQSAGNDSGIADGISMAFRYSLYLGIFCVGVFTVFGEALGLQIFKSQDAGSFIQILAWLCPFLYLATSSGSILNGLGKTKLTFFHHLISLLVRIAFVWFGIPEFGIRACLWGMLASEMLLALLHILALRRIVPCDWNAWILIGKPVFCLLCALWLFRLFPETLPLPAGLPDFFRTAVQILLLSTMYLLFLLFFHRKQSPAST